MGTLYGLPDPVSGLPEQVGYKWSDVVRTLKAASAKVSACPILYIDDASLSVQDYVEANSAKSQWDGIDAATTKLTQIQDLSDEYVDKGGIVVWTYHEASRRKVAGEDMIGGPFAPGRIPKKIAPRMDIVLRAVHEPSQEPWPWVMWSQVRSDWTAGDRLNVFPDCCPMNLPEGLRHAGYDIPYAECMKPLAGAVESLAQALAKDPDNHKPICRSVGEQLLEKKANPLHVRLVINDGIARHLFRKIPDVLGWL